MSSSDWGTPDWIIKMSHRVLGSIDLDPSSSAFWNSAVGAKRFIDKTGLESPWLDRPGNLFINPPGGKVKTKSSQILFWERLMKELSSGLVGHALFLGFSIEGLRTSQLSKCEPMVSFPFCIPRKRIKFVHLRSDNNVPRYTNAIIYVPGTVDKTELFANTFSSCGSVVINKYRAAKPVQLASIGANSIPARTRDRSPVGRQECREKSDQVPPPRLRRLLPDGGA